MQKAVASDLNIGNTTLSNYYHNLSSPKPETLIAIADYFYTTVEYLLGRTDDPAPVGSTGERDGTMLQTFNSLSDENKNLMPNLPRFYYTNRKVAVSPYDVYPP